MVRSDRYNIININISNPLALLSVAAVFQFSRKVSKEMGKSFIDYTLGMPLFNVIDADNTEFVLTNPNLLSKGKLYDFVKPALCTGILTASRMIWNSPVKYIYNKNLFVYS